MTKWLRPDVSARELMTLPEMNALVRTKLDGGITELFTMNNPLAPAGHVEWAEAVLRRSDRVDGRPADQVDQDIAAMYSASKGSTPGKVGEHRGSARK